MRVLRLRFAVFAAAVTIAPPLLAHAPGASAALPTMLPAPAQGAAATVDAFHAALRRGDTRSAAALLADDALVFEAGSVERTKAEYEAHHLSADAAFSQAVQSGVTRRAGNSDGALAWIASEGRTTGIYKGKAVDRLTAETMILRRSGEAWRIVHIHWSSAAKPK